MMLIYYQNRAPYFSVLQFNKNIVPPTQSFTELGFARWDRHWPPHPAPFHATGQADGIDIIHTPFQHTWLSDRGLASAKERIQGTLDEFLGKESAGELAPANTDNLILTTPERPLLRSRRQVDSTNNGNVQENDFSILGSARRREPRHVPSSRCENVGAGVGDVEQIGREVRRAERRNLVGHEPLPLLASKHAGPLLDRG
jgi:hypothetical protein